MPPSMSREREKQIAEHQIRTSSYGEGNEGREKRGLRRGGEAGWFLHNMKRAAAAVCCEKSSTTHASEMPVARSWHAYSLTHSKIQKLNIDWSRLER